MRFLMAGAAVLIVYVVLVVIFNRNASMQGGQVDLPGAGRAETQAELSITTWNIGYAGLGKESDFAVDGGSHLFPPSRAVVRKNIAEIERTATSMGADVVFFQEVAFSGPLTLWHSLAQRLESAMGTQVFWFRPDISTRLVPWPLRLRHGTVIATDLAPKDAALRPIIGEPDPIFGVVRRQYAMQVLRLAGHADDPDWVLINVHLSAFDGGGSVRRQQIRAVFDYAQEQFDLGARVVIGGDWNMELTAPDFDHTTDAQYLFWIHPFPKTLVPADWQIAIDPSMPTVRTVHQPFVPGDNYTTIIDGFIVSPNVDIVSVETRDTGFEMSDHMPVSAVFRSKEDD